MEIKKIWFMLIDGGDDGHTLYATDILLIYETSHTPSSPFVGGF